MVPAAAREHECLRCGERRLRVGPAPVRRGRGNAAAYNLLCHELQLLDSEPAAAGAANLLAFRLKLLLAAGFVPELTACAAAASRSRGRRGRYRLLAGRGRHHLRRLRAGEGFSLDGDALGS